MQTPLVSIIIPTYNRAHLIVETLESVLAQTYTNWECIVVDDGSIDETCALLNEYCGKDNRFQYHHRPKDRPKGANACRNYGFELSKGEYVNWFDDDDLMHQDKLLIQVGTLENNDYRFSVCQTLIFENSINNIIGLRSENIYSKDVFYDYLTQKIAWMTPSAFWKKSFLQTFEYLFDEDLQAAQEWEFHCRVLLCCKDYNIINEPLVYIRQHSESISYNDNTVLRELNYYKAREKIYFLIKTIDVSNNVKSFMNDYFFNHFKQFIFTRSINKAFYALRHHILPNEEIRLLYKIKMIAVFISFSIFNKGEILFKGRRYKITKP